MPTLPDSIVAHIFSFLGPNVVNCTIRLINKAAAAQYRDPDPARRPIVRLSKPVPRHAFAQRCTRAWTRTLSYKRRLKLLCLTAASGDLINLELAVGAAGCVLRDKIMEAAATAGHLHVCQWLRQRGCNWGKALEFAAKAGKRELCKWLLASGCLLPHDAVYVAALGGHLGLMARLWQRIDSDEWNIDVGELLLAVAHGCDLPTLQLCYSSWRRVRMLRQQVHQQQAVEQQLSDTEQQLESTSLQLKEQRQQQQQEAQGNGGDEQHQLFVLQLEHQMLQQQRQELQKEIDKRRVQGLGAGEQHQEQQPPMAEGGEERTKKKVLFSACGSPTPDWRDKVTYLEDQGCPRTPEAAAGAARLPGEAAVERLRWLRERGYELGASAVAAAAGAGNTAALKYLLNEASVEGDVRTLRASSPASTAAAQGHLPALQLLRARGCGMHPLFCLCCAAAEGHLHIVSWLVATFGLTAAVLQQHAAEHAVKSGSMELVDWMAGRGCNLSGVDGILTHAAEGGCEVMLERLVGLGCPWPETGDPYSRAALNGDLATLDCLRRLGCPWGPRAWRGSCRAK